MISAQDALALCAASYAESATIEAGDAHVLIRETNGVLVAAFRGSYSVEDWLTNFRVCPHTCVDHPQLGSVHGGFLDDACAVYAVLMSAIGDRPVWIVYHSKGVEGALVAGMMVAAGKPPMGLTGFGPPRIAGPGNTVLAGLLAGIGGVDYANAGDPVPDVPFLFSHHRPVVMLGSSGLIDVAQHYLASYGAALAAAPKAA